MSIRCAHPGTVRRLKAAGIAIGMLVSLAGCLNDDEPETLPTETTSTGPNTSDTPAPPVWESKYTQKQLQAYEAALTRWETYEQRSEPIWAAGKATAAAGQLFKEFFLNPDAQDQTLQTYEHAAVKIEGTPSVYWSKASSISSDKDTGQRAATVDIQQCVDYRSMRTTQYGEPTKPVKERQRPVLRKIHMMRLATTWLISEINQAPGRKDRPCSPNS